MPLGKNKWAVPGDKVTEHTSEHHNFIKWEGGIPDIATDEYLNIVSYNKNKIPLLQFITFVLLVEKQIIDDI